MPSSATLVSLRASVLLLSIAITTLHIFLNTWWSTLRAGCQSSPSCNIKPFDQKLTAWRFGIAVGVLGISSSVGSLAVAFVREKQAARHWVAIIGVDAMMAVLFIADAILDTALLLRGVCDAAGPYAAECRQVPAAAVVLYLAFVVTLVAVVVGVLGRSRAQHRPMGMAK
nr:hypothetical protein B0A51_10522 [Rachicladosporium sp. CCFEE 5018]